MNASCFSGSLFVLDNFPTFNQTTLLDMVGEFSQSEFQSFKKEQDFCLIFKLTGSEEDSVFKGACSKAWRLMFNPCKHTLWTQISKWKRFK